MDIRVQNIRKEFSRYPALHDVSLNIVSGELIARTDVLRRHPQLGRPLGHRHEYREIVLTVLGGTYALQYRYDGSSGLMLRVFHGRERR